MWWSQSNASNTDHQKQSRIIKHECSALKMVFVAISIAFNLINNNNVALCARRTTHSRRVVFFRHCCCENKKKSYIWFTLRTSIKSSVLVTCLLYLVISLCILTICIDRIEHTFENYFDKLALRFVLLKSAFFVNFSSHIVAVFFWIYSNWWVCHFLSLLLLLFCLLFVWWPDVMRRHLR